MRADFEKGTKVCSCCRRELSISCFYKNKRESDELNTYCKECYRNKRKQYYNNDIEHSRKKNKEIGDKFTNTFQRRGKHRGNGGMLKRDYELTEEQLKRRNRCRKQHKKNYYNINAQGILIWYDGKLNELDSKEYKKIMGREYAIQRVCAIRGCVGVKQPSEHFLFDFDLEQMLEINAHYNGGGGYRYYITKWWKGEIRHWTVNDGIWREQ